MKWYEGKTVILKSSACLRIFTAQRILSTGVFCPHIKHIEIYSINVCQIKRNERSHYRDPAGLALKYSVRR